MNLIQWPLKVLATPLYRNIAWNYISGIVSTVSVLALLPWSLRVCGAQQYSLWLIFFSGIQLLGLTDFGLGTGIVRVLGNMNRLGADRDRIREFTTLSLALFFGLSLTVSTAAFLVGPFLIRVATGFTSLVELAPVLLVIASLTLLLTLFSRGAIAILWAEDRPDIERKWVIAGLFVRIGGLLIGPYTPVPIIAVAVFEAVALTLPGLASFGLVLWRFPPVLLARSRLFADLSNLTKVSSVLFVATFAAVGAGQMPLYLVSSRLGLVAGGAFAALMRVYQSARMIVSWTTNPFTAQVSIQERGSVQLTKTYIQLSQMALLVSTLLAAPLLTMPSSLLELWLGPSYEFASSGLQAIAIITLCMALVLPANLFVNLQGKPIHSAILHTIWLASVAGLCLTEFMTKNFFLIVGIVGLPLLVLTPFFAIAGFKAAAPSASHLTRTARITCSVMLLILIVAFASSYIRDVSGKNIVGLVFYCSVVAISILLLILNRGRGQPSIGSRSTSSEAS